MRRTEFLVLGMSRIRSLFVAISSYYDLAQLIERQAADFRTR
jgi:hypothetical protein